MSQPGSRLGTGHTWDHTEEGPTGRWGPRPVGSALARRLPELVRVDNAVPCSEHGLVVVRTNELDVALVVEGDG